MIVALYLYVTNTMGKHMGSTTSQISVDPSKKRSSNKDDWLRSQQIELLFDKSYVSLLATTVSAVILVGGLWFYEPRTVLPVWLSFVLLITAARFGILYLYLRSNNKRDQCEKWFVWFTAGVFLSGLTWGVGGILLPPAHSIATTVITLLILGSLLVASVIAYSAVIFTFLAFSLSITIPIAVYLIAKGDSVMLAIGVMVIVLLGLLLLYALRLNKTIINMIELQFDNAELISKLDNEKKEVENRVKEKTNDLHISENKFASAFRFSPDAITIFRMKDGRIIDINTSHEQLSGFTRDELLEKSIYELGIWRDPEDRFRFIKAIHKKGSIHHWPTDLVSRNGEIKHCEVSADVAVINNEQCIVTVTRDMTERKRVEAALIDGEARFKNIFEYAPIGVGLGDEKGNILQINEAASEILGYSVDELVGKNFIDFVHPDEKEISKEHHMKLFSGELESYRLEKRYRHKKGHYIWVSLNVSIVKDQNEVPSYLIAQIEDISKARKLTEQLSYEATHDSLTSLINRREFENRIKLLIDTSKLDRSEHALCYLDLDQFKILNDTYGHAAGDELLRQLSKHLQNQIREQDTIARLGGDEFGILMEHCSIENASQTCNLILKEIREFQFIWEGHAFNVGASIGLVTITKDSSMTNLFKAADAACYTAKDLGRNRIHLFNEDDVELSKRYGEMLWVSRINEAIKENRFFLVAQPIQSLDEEDQSKSKLEILLRMKDEYGETILPGVFLPAAERYGLISKLDRWVINATVTTINQDKSLLSNLSMCSINLSGQSIGDKDFREFVELIFDTYPESIDKICFEITETAAIDNFSNAIDFINTFKKRGCRFALDDFGSGLSSFGYLKNLPVDYVKIDGMFVKDIVDDPIDYAMVKSINDIGQVMGMQTIAEFVETDEINSMLKDIGVNYTQGYAIGRPRPFSMKVNLRAVS
jgi:diguanylate cyclase (GGDEF)-like protein/PAS domain S-box-containing protein